VRIINTREKKNVNIKSLADLFMHAAFAFRSLFLSLDVICGYQSRREGGK
jgi:hypothetical protein